LVISFGKVFHVLKASHKTVEKCNPYFFVFAPQGNLRVAKMDFTCGGGMKKKWKGKKLPGNPIKQSQGRPQEPPWGRRERAR